MEKVNQVSLSLLEVPLIDLLRREGVLGEDHWSRASA